MNRMEASSEPWPEIPDHRASHPMAVVSHLPRPPAEGLRRVGRRTVAIVAAAAMALGLLAGTSVPARADSDDLAKALAALAIVGIIASQANQNRGNGGNAHRGKDHRHHQPVPVQGRNRIPAVCAIEIAGNAGTATVYGERCLREEGIRARLPDYCARNARIYGQQDRIYSDQCLRDAGFRVGGHRY